MWVSQIWVEYQLTLTLINFFDKISNSHSQLTFRLTAYTYITHDSCKNISEPTHSLTDSSEHLWGYHQLTLTTHYLYSEPLATHTHESWDNSLFFGQLTHNSPASIDWLWEITHESLTVRWVSYSELQLMCEWLKRLEYPG